ncbi:hypothetical protein [Streptomyces sp. NPDC050388]|uniref:hypothetical protein n=1 Tax=Streptomyces sp. NPDC050388 TaxID=3155781 RepID=UPI00342F58A7
MYLLLRRMTVRAVMATQKPEVDQGGGRDKNLAAGGRQGWFAGRSWGTISDEP